MKTFKNFIQSIILVIFTTSLISVNAQEITINAAFSSDTTFNPFNGEKGIYSFKMSGGIDLLSDSSLVRVILIDDKENHYLIYESYPLITNSNNFSIENVCDETCYLNAITPGSIRIDIINAIVSIDRFIYDLNPITNIYELQQQAKWLSDSVKISIMNQRIKEENMYWRAGRTDLLQMNFAEKEKYFGDKFNLEGFDYYKGGIFEFISRRSYSYNTGIYVEKFDWRNRHGADTSSSHYWNGRHDSTGWLTPIKNQGSCGSCYIFGPVGEVEARANIYYNAHYSVPNYHHYDVNLSEQQILSCMWGTTFHDTATCNGGMP